MRKDIRGSSKAAVKKAGVRRIRIHDLRHTFASHFMMKGGNILTLQTILGHLTLAVTLRYAHLARDFMKEEMCGLEFSKGKFFDLRLSPICHQAWAVAIYPEGEGFS